MFSVMESTASLICVVVLSGLFTSFIYLVLFGLRWRSQIKSTLRNRTPAKWLHLTQCFRCGRISYHKEHCHKCEKNICQDCTVLLISDRLCSFCIKERDRELSLDDWKFKELRERLRLTVATKRSLKNKDKDVRDVIENLTEKLIGGSIDDVRISQVSSHPAYIDFVGRYRGVLSLTLSCLLSAFYSRFESISKSKKGDLRKQIHLRLEELIGEIIHEATKLPTFKDHANGTIEMESLWTKTYEDILAMAILNKVCIMSYLFTDTHTYKLLPAFWIVENFQDQRNESTQRKSKNGDFIIESREPFTNENTEIATNIIRPNWQNLLDEERFSFEDDDNERKIKLDQPHNHGNYENQYGESEINVMEENIGSNTLGRSSQWEDNWLFKKKPITHSHYSPVTMLVPSPNKEVRALIGDIDADETSNLSDCSESELIELLDSGETLRIRDGDIRGIERDCEYTESHEHFGHVRCEEYTRSNMETFLLNGRDLTKRKGNIPVNQLLSKSQLTSSLKEEVLPLSIKGKSTRVLSHSYICDEEDSSSASATEEAEDISFYTLQDLRNRRKYRKSLEEIVFSF